MKQLAHGLIRQHRVGSLELGFSKSDADAHASMLFRGHCVPEME